MGVHHFWFRFRCTPFRVSMSLFPGGDPSMYKCKVSLESWISWPLIFAIRVLGRTTTRIIYTMFKRTFRVDTRNVLKSGTRPPIVEHIANCWEPTMQCGRQSEKGLACLKIDRISMLCNRNNIEWKFK